MNINAIKSLGDLIWRPFDFIGKQVDFYQQRKNDAHAQKLREQDARAQQQLEMERQRFELEQDQQRQRLNAELDDFVARKEIERRAMVAQSIANYQKTMAECAVSIGKSLGEMKIDLLDSAAKLIYDKQRQCKQMQDEALDAAIATMEKINAKFPQGNKILENAVDKTLTGVIERSDEFLKTLNKEFDELVHSINDTTDSTVKLAQSHILPKNAENFLSQGNHVAALIDQK